VDAEDVEDVVGRGLAGGAAEEAGGDIDVGRWVQHEGGEQGGLAGEGVGLDSSPPLRPVTKGGEVGEFVGAGDLHLGASAGAALAWP